MSSSNKTPGELIKERREKLSLTQDQLAETLGVTRNALSSYESDRNFPPGKALGALADALNTSADYLLGRTDNPAPPRNKNEVPDEDELKRRKFLIEMEEILRKSSDLDDTMIAHSLRIMEVTFLERLGESKRKNK